MKWLLYILMVMLMIKGVSAWETSTFYFTSSSAQSYYLNGTLNYTIINGTIQNINSVIFESSLQYSHTESNVNMTLSVNGQSCNPATYVFDIPLKGSYVVDFDCKSIVNTPGLYNYSFRILGTYAPDVIFSKTIISYAYADGFIDSIFYNANQIWSYLSGWVTTAITGIWSNTNSTLTLTQQINQSQINQTSQLIRIESKIDNLTERFDYMISSVSN